MTRSNEPVETKGRIEQHGEGTGPLDATAVERRAEELAVIDGRSAEEVNEADRERARLELKDETLLASEDQDHRSDRVASSNPADIGVETGHEVAAQAPVDEQHLREEQVSEGVREAEHERMLRGQKQTGEDIE